MKFNRRKYIKKFNFINLIFSLLFIGLITYSFKLQFFNKDIYSAEVSINTIKQRKIPAPRGTIFDRNGIILASTEYQNDLYIIPHYFHDNSNLICDTIRIDCKILNNKIKKFPYNRFLVATNLSDQLAQGFQSIPGLFIFRTSNRVYNAETATSHIVGYVGRINHSMLEIENSESIYADDDNVGRSGLEYIYDKDLHGLNGMEQYVVMANGMELLSPNRFIAKDDTLIKPMQGNDLILSIDDKIQLVFAKEMGFKKGAAVMIDVHTGAVIAMYSSPGFNQDKVSASFGDNSFPLINRVIRPYAPGSTFKLVTALAALEMGIDPYKKEECHGSYSFGGRVFHCWKHEGHGAINMHDAIKHSCDIYFYNLAQKVGLSNIIKYARKLGFDQFTGIDLDTETAGSLPIVKKSTPGTLLNTVIGQGVVLTTPLQLANAYATIVNGGELHAPRLVLYGEQPMIIGENHFKKSSINFLMNALYSVVNEEGGTAFFSKSSLIEIAGKTGTAQVAGLDKKKKDNGLFVGYYPVVNPQIAVCVVIEQGEHGSSVAPIGFKAIEEYSKNYAPISYQTKN